MVKRIYCREFKTCVNRFEKIGTDFTCEGCPGPDFPEHGSGAAYTILSRWEINKLEREKRIEKCMGRGEIVMNPNTIESNCFGVVE